MTDINKNKENKEKRYKTFNTLILSLIGINMGSKLIKTSQWFSHQLADLKLAKMIIGKNDINDQETKMLKRYISKKSFMIETIKFLSKSYINKTTIIPIGLYGLFYILKDKF